MKLVFETDNAGLLFLLASLVSLCLIEYSSNFIRNTVGSRCITNANCATKVCSALQYPTSDDDEKQNNQTPSAEDVGTLKVYLHKDIDQDTRVSMVTRMLPDPTAECFTPLRLINMEYAVRGEIPMRATQIAREIERGSGSKYPFKEIVYCNIGNPIQVGFKPLTYLRQVISTYWSQDARALPIDLRTKMDYVLSCTNPGAYTASRGHDVFVQMVERFLYNRDGFDCKSHKTSVFLSDGASSVITLMMEYLIDATLTSLTSPIPGTSQIASSSDDEDNTANVVENVMRIETGATTPGLTSLRDGVLLPVPQYPLYSATLARFGGEVIPYYLVEETEWSLPGMSVFESLYADALKDGILPRAIVIINPNNPTGSVTGEQQLLDLLKFAEKRKLIVLADEVYQTNIWGKVPFVSARHIVLKHKLDVKLCSFHSTSKGLWGECGARGGFMAMENFPVHIHKLVDKCVSVRLCPNVTGQLTMAFALHPPMKGDESYEIYRKEIDAAMRGYKRKASILFERFKKFKNLECQSPMGAMYMFPKVLLPDKAIEAAGAANMKPDAFYCMELLLNTGIVLVPGSGFGQVDGTYHFRITILPELDILVPAIDRFEKFHNNFMETYE